MRCRDGQMAQTLPSTTQQRHPISTYGGQNMLTTRRGSTRRFQSDMNRLLESLGGVRPLAAGYPAMNVWQDDANIHIEAELPGMDLSDLEIYVTGGNQLAVKGDRKAPQVEKAVWHRQERGFGAFSRLLTLPFPVDADKVQARLTNGVLMITLPKSEAAKPRRIAVQAE
jgi:HSP20 family protein